MCHYQLGDLIEESLERRRSLLNILLRSQIVQVDRHQHQQVVPATAGRVYAESPESHLLGDHHYPTLCNLYLFLNCVRSVTPEFEV